MKLHAFHGGGEVVDMAMFDPFHPQVGTKVEIPFFFYLIEHPEGNVLFDTGGHRDLITDPAGRLGAAAEAFQLAMQPGDDVVSQLATIGVTPPDIQHVAHSHLHYDHAGGIENFPDAKFHIQTDELAFAFSPPVYQSDIYVRADFDHDVRWNRIQGEHDIFDDGRLVLFPTPGHSKGHQSLLVRLNSQNIILVADAAYSRRNLDDNIIPGVVWSPDAMVESWQRIRDWQQRHSAQLLFTHDLAYIENTKVAPENFYE